MGISDQVIHRLIGIIPMGITATNNNYSDTKD